MLYDGALARIAQGRQRLVEGDVLEAGLSLHRSQAIVAELRNSLNMEEGGEIAANLDRLYSYIHQLLVKSMLENQSEPLDEAAGLLMELRGAWSEVAKPDKAPQEQEHRMPDSTMKVQGVTSESRLLKITV